MYQAQRNGRVFLLYLVVVAVASGLQTEDPVLGALKAVAALLGVMTLLIGVAAFFVWRAARREEFQRLARARARFRRKKVQRES